MTDDRNEGCFQVGELVRIPRDNAQKTALATIASLDGDLVDLFLEDAAPNPIFHGSKFIVSPRLQKTNSNDNEEEITMSIEKIQHLLPFERKQEKEEKERDDDRILSPHSWKEKGDALLKIGDPSSAVPYYEEALKATSMVQIGGTILVMEQKQNNELSILPAEVDCLEDGTADITFCKSGSETVVTLDAIQLGISLHYSDLQIRIVLNLARCMLQLADFDLYPSSRPALYRQGAVIACSMAYEILLLSIEEKEEEDIKESERKLILTCLLLRSKAYAGRAKWKLAMLDADRLLQLKPLSKENNKWKQELQSMIAKCDRSNKKLVKSMCKWIQTATKESGNKSSKEGKSVSSEVKAQEERDTTNEHSDIFQLFSKNALLVLIFAILTYQYFVAYSHEQDSL